MSDNQKKNSDQDPGDISDDRDARDELIYKKISARMRTEVGGTSDIEIEDLSRHGIRATCDNPPEVGDAIVISIDEFGEFEGVVRWVRQNHFGVHTVVAINYDELPSEE